MHLARGISEIIKKTVTGRSSSPVLLPLTSCSNWESGPYSSPRKNSKACPGCVNTGELDWRSWVQENLPHSFLPAAVDELAGTVLGSSLVMTLRECWRADQPSYHPCPEAGLWVSLPLISTWTVGECEGGKICRSKATRSPWHRVNRRKPSEGPY